MSYPTPFVIATIPGVRWTLGFRYNPKRKLPLAMGAVFNGVKPIEIVLRKVVPIR